MSNKSLPFYLVPGTEGTPTKYYLKSEDGNDTEITEWQYNELTALTEQPVSGNLTEADIARLHAESDPASPLFKGSEPVNAGVSGTADNQIEPAKAYYEPTPDKVEAAEAEVTEPVGTSVHGTEEITKANAGITSQELSQAPATEEVETEETKPEEDAGNTQPE